MVYHWEAYLRVSHWNSDYQSVKNLLRYLNNRKTASDGSRNNYCRTLCAFCQFVGKLPDELVGMKKVEIEKCVEDFCYNKKEGGCCARTVNVLLVMLKTFFKVNGFKGNERLEVEAYHQPARFRTRNEYIPTLEEARRMANVAGSLRNRAIILFTLSTGLRNSTLRAVLYGDVKEELERDTANILIKVHANMKKVVPSACKGNIEYSVFTSQEAAEALRLYVADRRRRSGEIQYQEILFCSENNRLPRSRRGCSPLTSRELEIIVKEVARKAGVKEWVSVTPHCLRKAFESVLRSRLTDGGRLDVKTQEYFMGHILAGSMDTYFDKSKADELRKEYARLLFKPQEQGKVEVLETLQNIAETMGVDYTRLEESKKKELGRVLNDAEKLIIVQEAFKQTAKVLKSVSESGPKTIFPANGLVGIFEGNQNSAGKTQLTPEDVETRDGFPPKSLLPESVPTLVSLSGRNRKTYISPNENNEAESIQLSLSMLPQECQSRLEQIPIKRLKSSEIPLIEPTPNAISSERNKQTCTTSPNKNNEMRSTQLTLFMVPREDTYRTKSSFSGIHRLEPKSKVKTDLSSFLQSAS